MDEIMRRLHNFASAVFSVVDHTRKLVRKAYDPEDSLRVAYEDRTTHEFAGWEPAQFWKGLRNYLLHYGLPRQTVSLDLAPPPGRLGASILLHRDDLLQFSGWSSVGLRFLKRQPATIELEQLLHDYMHVAAEFQTWLVQAIATRHRADIDERNALVEEEHRLLRRQPKPI